MQELTRRRAAVSPARRWVWALGVVLLAAVAAGVAASGPPVRAAGEGVFSLDQPFYSTEEGTAALVTVLRTGGGTLTNDVTVTLQLSGGIEGDDYEVASTTQSTTFPKNQDVTARTVAFQTLNREKPFDKTIQVTIISVSAGLLGSPSTAPITLLGRGTPRVHDVTPKSGGLGDIVFLHGVNFANGGTVSSACNLYPGGVAKTTCQVEFYPYGGGPGVPATAFTVVDNTTIRATVPALTNDTLYDIRVTVIVVPRTGTDDEVVSLSPVEPGDVYHYTNNTNGPTINRISPASGPATGGTVVTIDGTHLGSACASGHVWFDVREAPTGTCVQVSANEIRIKTPGPPTNSPGLVNVVITGLGSPTPVTSETTFTFTGAPIITSISPSFGPATGGTTVTIVGSGYSGIHCPAWAPPGPPPVSSPVLFGSTPALSCVANSDGVITAVSPPNVGVRQVSVTNQPGGTSAFTTAANFTFITGPVIEGVDPNTGPPQGGTPVQINGAGFSPGATVTFGGVPATSVIYDNPTHLTATAPPGHGPVHIVVTVGTQSSPATGTDLFYYSNPEVTSITPNAGPTAGGTVVTINGTNFTTNATVQFGALSVAATFVSPILIMAATPKVDSGQVVDVRVTTPSGQSTGGVASFTYTDGPIVTGLNPTEGKLTGGEIVVITGTNFVDVTQVTFGDAVAPQVNVNSPTQITVLTPAVAAAGTIDVKVKTAKGLSPVNPKTAFKYKPAVPVITSISPDKGPTAGGTTIQITGVGFLGVTCPGGVKFGPMAAASCTVNNDNSITAVTPSNVAGLTILAVTSNSGTSDLAQNFTYEPTVPGPPGGGGGPGGGGTGGGGTGGGVTLPPPTGQMVTYELHFRWTLIVWRGADGMSVRTALGGADGKDVSGKVSALFTWDAGTNAWHAYFTGAEDIPGASDFTTLTRGAVYWVAIVPPGPATWTVKDG